MTTQIDFRTLPANVPVLCIPRVYPNISESRIRRIFDELGMGTLERIDIVSKTSEKGDKFNRVFVHFKRWNDSDNANIARERLLNGKDIKIIYDEPWFWKISAYREAATHRESAPPKQYSGRGKATITFDSDEDKSSKPRVPANHYSNRDNRPRRDDRRYTTGYPVDTRRRDDSRERSRRDNNKSAAQEKPVRKFMEPRTPSASPPRQHNAGKDESEMTAAIDYGNIMPPKRRTAIGGNKPALKIEKEEGEVSDVDETS